MEDKTTRVSHYGGEGEERQCEAGGVGASTEQVIFTSDSQVTILGLNFLISKKKKKKIAGVENPRVALNLQYSVTSVHFLPSLPGEWN